MPVKGRVLVVGGDQTLIGELTPSMTGREFEVAAVPDARQASLKLVSESFSALIVDFARVPAPDREALGKLQKERGGFLLIGIEATPTLSPTTASPLRRLPWPLPTRFLDQVRAVDNPVVFLVEPTLYVTNGMQAALRASGIMFFQLDNELGLVDMMRVQLAKLEEYNAKSKPGKTGFWERLSGGGKDANAPMPADILGHIAAVKFAGSWTDAGPVDARIRQALPGAVVYHVTTVDVVRTAVAALKATSAAILPREQATRIAEIVADATSENKSAAPREKERILLNDNEMPVLSRLSETLIALGYEVVATTSGEEALRLVGQKFAEKKPFHLAAIGGSALEGTKLSGANLALKMREKDKEIRLVLMIDQFPVDQALKGVSRAVELGLDDAILKPIDVSRLVLSVQRALESRYLKMENIRLRDVAEDAARKLAQVNGFQTKFFATVAHDVKNPLTAILGYSEVLGMRLKDKPDELKCASHIHNAAKTLNLLVSDLVDLAAIESGKLRVEIGQLDLAQVISDVKSRVEIVAARKQLTFTSVLPPSLPMLAGDPHRIGQVVQNLCTNAVQYTKEGGRMSIEVKVDGAWIIVGVRDTGIGISKEDLPRVWERFFQTKEAQTMRKAGFGLGLKIAREIVQMHGGDMGIESELGVGSFFFFKLPIPKGAAAIATPAVAAPAASAAPAAVPPPPVTVPIPPPAAAPVPPNATPIPAPITPPNPALVPPPPVTVPIPPPTAVPVPPNAAPVPTTPIPPPVTVPSPPPTAAPVPPNATPVPTPIPPPAPTPIPAPSPQTGAAASPETGPVLGHVPPPAATPAPTPKTPPKV
jgi:signal transduction histidine kinase